jgi:diaminohydroxyphosphoribosylaminopyrimidine deaminase/5-amino-6-(5-phosphoribosylamino)uracil reductase
LPRRWKTPEVNDVLVEAGPELAGALLAAGLADELVVYLAPMLLGDGARGMFHLPGLDCLQDHLALEIEDTRMVGRDLRVTLKPVGEE